MNEEQDGQIDAGQVDGHCWLVASSLLQLESGSCLMRWQLSKLSARSHSVEFRFAQAGLLGAQAAYGSFTVSPVIVTIPIALVIFVVWYAGRPMP